MLYIYYQFMKLVLWVKKVVWDVLIQLEITVRWAVAVILMTAAAKIFVWMSNRMVQREKDYNETRDDAASEDTEKSDKPVFVDESGYPDLDVLEEYGTVAKCNSPR